jgi:lysophospholipase L1-like esterase
MRPRTHTCLSLLAASALLAASCSNQTTPARSPTQAAKDSAPAASAPIPSQPAAAPAPEQKATVAAPKVGNAAFFEKHGKFLARGKEGPIGLLFIGDSITEQWNKAPEIWSKYFGAYRPANFGIGGDQTQHVLWRIENGELDGINPKVVVLMIGTNNSAAHSGKEIAEANRMIVEQIQRRLPRAKVLLLAIFPRDPRPDRPDADHWEKRMTAIRTANAELARMDNGRSVRFLDLGPKFTAPDGTIPDEIMPDQLHLSPAGYEIWARNMQPLLEEMLAN